MAFIFSSLIGILLHAKTRRSLAQLTFILSTRLPFPAVRSLRNPTRQPLLPQPKRGIARRLADSLALRRFLRIGWDERTPDQSTISRTRRLMDIDTHREVFFGPGSRHCYGIKKCSKTLLPGLMFKKFCNSDEVQSNDFGPDNQLIGYPASPGIRPSSLSTFMPALTSWRRTRATAPG